MVSSSFFFPISPLFIIWLTIVPPAAEHDPFMCEFIGLHVIKKKQIWQGLAVSLASLPSLALNTRFIKQLMQFKQYLGICPAQMLLDKMYSVFPLFNMPSSECLVNQFSKDSDRQTQVFFLSYSITILMVTEGYISGCYCQMTSSKR